MKVRRRKVASGPGLIARCDRENYLQAVVALRWIKLVVDQHPGPTPLLVELVVRVDRRPVIVAFPAGSVDRIVAAQELLKLLGTENVRQA
jgi:hypothetical protein